MNPLAYFGVLLRASLLSTGGTGNLPAVHHDLMLAGEATEAQFTQALLLGQITPGPNGLWVVCLGYLTRGPLGALMASVAVALPPLLVLLVDRIYQKIDRHPAVEGFVRGLSLGICGMFAAVLATLLKKCGAPAQAVTIALIACAGSATKRLSPPMLISIAAAAGIVMRLS